MFIFQILHIVMIMVSATVVSFEAKRSRHRSYSINDKRESIQVIDTLVSIGISYREACSCVGLPHMYYTHFKKVVEKFETLEKSDVYIPYKMNGSARKIHPGHSSLLTTIQEDLAHFIMQARQAEFRAVPI